MAMAYRVWEEGELRALAVEEAGVRLGERAYTYAELRRWVQHGETVSLGLVGRRPELRLAASSEGEAAQIVADIGAYGRLPLARAVPCM